MNSTQNHGGVKRSRQLMMLGEKNNCSIINIPTTSKLMEYCLQNPRSWIQAIFKVIKLAPFVTFKGLVIGYMYSIWLHDFFRNNKLEEIHLEVCTGSYIIFGFLMIQFGIPIIAYPQNIEFMVPGQESNLFRSELLAQHVELTIYRYANSINTISGFDAAVLKCFNISNVQTLPYEPVEEDRLWLSAIKMERTVSTKLGFLILGTVGNIVTKNGIIELLDMIKNNGGFSKYYLVGFGTESLKELASKNVEVYGSVNQDMLRGLLVHCSALLIRQPPTTGMITRISEALFADIPIYIFSDYIQAYNINNKNLHIISSLDELPV